MPDGISNLELNRLRADAINNLAAQNTAMQNLSVRNFTVNTNANLPAAEQEAMQRTIKTKIMEAALLALQQSPGFNPAAFSASFALRW